MEMLLLRQYSAVFLFSLIHSSAQSLGYSGYVFRPGDLVLLRSLAQLEPPEPHLPKGQFGENSESHECEKCAPTFSVITLALYYFTKFLLYPINYSSPQRFSSNDKHTQKLRFHGFSSILFLHEYKYLYIYTSDTIFALNFVSLFNFYT